MQLILIGYNQPHMTAPLREKVKALKSDPAVRVVDVLCVHRTQDGAVEREQVGDLIPEHPHEPGAMIDTLLSRGQAAKTMGQTPQTGSGYLFRGDLLPDPRESIPRNSGVLAILLEHRWATPLRDTAADTGAYPVADGWMGHEALKEVQLIPPEP